MRKVFGAAFLILLALAVWASPLFARNSYIQEFEKRVTEFDLPNGLKFIVIRREVAPVVSFVTFVNVGNAQSPAGHSGIAHILEHMAFKGTKSIGTKDWDREKPLLRKMDRAYKLWLRERSGLKPDPEVLKRRRKHFEKLRRKADKYVKNNEFPRILKRNGATGLNAYTSNDETNYLCSLPANRIELWFCLESDRLKNPVFREFYSEKKVILEERRMHIDSDPLGRLLTEFLAVAYSAHPYGNPVLGWESDIIGTTIADVREFYETYYVPENITIAVAGDIDPVRIKELAELYFGGIPSRGPSPILPTEEPPQRGERRFVLEESIRPFYIEGYHTVSATHPDSPALDLLSIILSRGRTSRLYRQLVERQRLVTQVDTFHGYPGDKYESLFAIFAVPNTGVSPGSVEKAIRKEIREVKNGAIAQEDLDRAQTKERASLIRSLDSNQGLAKAFASAEEQRGDWREVFRRLDRLDQVTLKDLQRVAKTYLNKKNRTVGMIKTVTKNGGCDAE